MLDAEIDKYCVEHMYDSIDNDPALEITGKMQQVMEECREANKREQEMLWARFRICELGFCPREDDL